MNNGENSGLSKSYENDEGMTNFISKEEQISSAGWIDCIIRDASLNTHYSRKFFNHGVIREG
jgi:hypothetical protein